MTTINKDGSLKVTTEYLNDLQVGGDHYAGSYQHWDWAADVGLGYFESAATKYLFRWYKKNGIEDLDKARSYLIKAQQLFNQGRWINDCTHVSTFAPIRNASDIYFMKFVDKAKVPLVEHKLCYMIANWKTDADLQVTIDVITTHLKAVQGLTRLTRGFAPLKPLEGAQQAQTMPNQPYDGVAMQAFGPCPCGCGFPRAKGQEFAHPQCEQRHKYGKAD